MSLNLASLNARGLRDSSRANFAAANLENLGVDVATVQETHFESYLDEYVLRGKWEVHSAYGRPNSRGVSLLVKQSLEAATNIVYAGAEGRLIVADVEVKKHTFRVIAVYAPNCVGQRRSFFRRLEKYMTYPGRLVLMGDWNAILDPKIDRGRGARGSGRCENSLINLMASNNLVDRYRLDHPGEEMWTWARSSSLGSDRSYLDRVLVRRADIDFVGCPVFHRYTKSDHKLLTVTLRLSDRPRLASYWKFNTSLLEIRDFRERLELVLQRALVGAVIGNKWWGTLKYRIRDFAIKYGQRLALDKAAKAKDLEDRVSRAEDGGDPLALDLARRGLERLASERYQGYIVRSRLKKSVQ